MSTQTGKNVPLLLDVPLSRRQESGGCLRNGLQRPPAGNVGHVEKGIFLKAIKLQCEKTIQIGFEDFGIFRKKLCHISVFSLKN